MEDSVEILKRRMSEAKRAIDELLQHRLERVAFEPGSADQRCFDELEKQLERVNVDLAIALERLESRTDSGRWFLGQGKEQ